MVIDGLSLSLVLLEREGVHLTKLESLPADVLLHIFSYLDLPELDALARLSPEFFVLAHNPALHRVRLRVVAPSRVSHALFGADAGGVSLRPSLPELVHRCVLKGLGLERRWRMGQYWNSRESVRQYEISQRLKRSHVRAILSTHLQTKSPSTLARVLPEVYNDSPASPTTQQQIVPASTSGGPPKPVSTKGKGKATISTATPKSAIRASIAPRLLPAMRSLKWSIRRDALARTMRSRGSESCGDVFLRWHGLWKEDERVRLAICPGVGKIVHYFESLSTKS